MQRHSHTVQTHVLPAHACLWLRGSAQVRALGEAGCCLWLTRAGCAEDVFLSSHELLTTPNGSVWLVQNLGPQETVLQVRRPAQHSPLPQAAVTLRRFGRDLQRAFRHLALGLREIRLST